MAARDRLDTYRAKRDFERTPEPAGSPAPRADGHRFVVQRHRATRLHYDLRLEADGVLMSWAVPKGPTRDPNVRRMAVHVEDHPLEYFDFEGVIPRGEYGGGDVIVWDWGTWQQAEGDDPVAAVEAGNLHFDLSGEKLAGRFVLIRTGRRANGSRSDKDWLLLHKHDDAAVDGWDAEDHPRSVKSGRTNDEVKDAPAATWSSATIWAAPTEAELLALADLGPTGTWHLGDERIRLTDLDARVVEGRGRSGGVTKRELVAHLTSMAPAMLPYLDGHDVHLRRGWTAIDSPAALAKAGNQRVVELRMRAAPGKTDRPSWAVLAIRPSASGCFDDALVLARLCHTALDHLRLRAAPKVDGDTGIEVWIPVGGRAGLDDVRAWVDRLATVVAATVPDLAGAVSLNAPDAELLVPFSPRAVPGAPLSVPITWQELDDPQLAADRWTIADAAARLATAGDPLAALIGVQQRLPQI